jgi:hypothetical protein
LAKLMVDADLLYIRNSTSGHSSAQSVEMLGANV